MSKIASYGCVSIPGLNQVKKMKVDANGYYECILGGFNTENQSGLHYPLTPSVKALYAKGGIVRRRLDEGLCRGEYDHPTLEGLSNPQIMSRLAIIKPDRVSHHIKSIDLVERKDATGRKIVLAMGMVKPAGPFADSLRASLENLDENVAFSIRCFSKPALWRGEVVKVVTDAMTYDYVSEPGIKTANQFATANLESLSDFVNIGKELNFTEQDFINAEKELIGCNLESSANTLSMVRTNLGWTEVPVIDVVSSISW